MKLNCIHCGGGFSVRTEQLGTAVACPHCQGVVNLPRATSDAAVEEEVVRREPSGLLTNSVSGLVSTVFHLFLLVLVALAGPCNSGGDAPGEGEDVMIGVMPSETLSDKQEESLDSSAADVESESAADEALDELEVDPPTETSDDSALDDIALNPTKLSGGGSSSFDLGMVSVGGGTEGGGWDGMLQRLRRSGLEIVIVFDSTGSMGGEISEVKRQAQRIGNSLIKLVPKARISIVTYRDEGSGYVVLEPILPLTSDIQMIDRYLEPIQANGGGDHEEAVQAGLREAIAQNEFRSGSRKVILLFGDAPPHARDQAECLRLAQDFHQQAKGVVSTVTCRNRTRLKEFIEIAQVGGGEAFLTTDEQQIMTQLMILVFGSQYRAKVLEAFELMEK
jgi:Mg-chelatase subunit ChlD